MNRRSTSELVALTLAAGLAASCHPHARAATAAEPGLDSAAAWHAARRFADSRFGRIAYVERGAGPVALFIHGFPLAGYQWRGALDRLGDIRRCIAPDLLGLGATEVAPGASVAPDAQVEMLVEFLDRLGIDAVDLVASDSGGAVAQLFAVRHPERVRTMLLTNCDVEIDSPPPAVLPVIELARAGRFADAWLAPWVADKALARSAEGLGGLAFTFPDRLADETIDIYLGPLVATEERKRLINAYAVGLAPNPLAGIEPLLRRSTIPTRIVWGTGDVIFSPGSPGYLDRTLGRSMGIRTVEGAKLFFPEEFPDLVAEEARSLWTTGADR